MNSIGFTWIYHSHIRNFVNQPPKNQKNHAVQRAKMAKTNSDELFPLFFKTLEIWPFLKSLRSTVHRSKFGQEICQILMDLKIQPRSLSEQEAMAQLIEENKHRTTGDSLTPPLFGKKKTQFAMFFFFLFFNCFLNDFSDLHLEFS